MKPKTLLFGAGQGSLQVISNLSHRFDFIGYLDNDSKKHGTFFEGLKVYVPSSLTSLEYDKIVISTQWSMSVREQLIEELGVDPEKIVLPEKKVFKNFEPFNNPLSLALGRKIITSLSQLAVLKNLPLVIDFGTLLGVVRDGDIIPWDDDIDFSVPIEFAQKTEDMLIEFCESEKGDIKWKVNRLKDKLDSIAGYTLKFSSTNSDIEPFTTSICFRKIRGENSEHLPSLGMWYGPKHHFESVETLVWRGKTIQVPSLFKEYLKFLYGNWKVPKKNLRITDYAHIRDVDFSEIERAGLLEKNILNNDK